MKVSPFHYYPTVVFTFYCIRVLDIDQEVTGKYKGDYKLCQCSVYMCVCVCVCVCLSVCLSVCLYVFLPVVCLSVSLCPVFICIFNWICVLMSKVVLLLHGNVSISVNVCV